MSILIARGAIVGALKAKVKEDERDANVSEDIARLVHLLLLSILFRPDNNSVVPWKLLRYLESFDQIIKYDWSGYIMEGLLESMRTTSTLKICGCSIFLLVSYP